MDAKSRKSLLSFLFWARQNHGYASGAKGAKLARGGEEFRCSRGKFSYWDEFFGFDPFIGQEMIWHDEKGWIWGMNYYGRTIKSNKRAQSDEIYAFLKSVLMKCNKGWPCRGPISFVQGVWVYECDRPIFGSLDYFWGNEKIYYKDVQVYRGEFHGGIVRGK